MEKSKVPLPTPSHERPSWGIVEPRFERNPGKVRELGISEVSALDWFLAMRGQVPVSWLTTLPHDRAEAIWDRISAALNRSCPQCAAVPQHICHDDHGRGIMPHACRYDVPRAILREAASIVTPGPVLAPAAQRVTLWARVIGMVLQVLGW